VKVCKAFYQLKMLSTWQHTLKLRSFSSSKCI